MRQVSYSHPATKQDLWVLEKTDGWAASAVELGAYDGLRHSNTKLLEEKGWKVILVEAVPEFAEQCQKNRPNAKVINKAVGDGESHMFMVGGQYSGLVPTMPESWIAEHNKRGNEVRTVKTYSLEEVIGATYCGYLSLDTEGNEYEILKDWLEAGGRAGLMTVEFRYDTALLDRLIELVEPYGYTLDELRGFDACFTWDIHEDKTRHTVTG